MKSAPRRPSRRLLVAGTGIVAVMFGGHVACGGGPNGTTIAPGPAGASTGGGFGATSTFGAHGATSGFGTLTGGGFGTTGNTTGAIQYCGVSDGGDPVPCDEADGGTGSVDGG